MNVKKLAVGLGILAILALDWAALHDIVKGSEANYTAEYIALALSVLVLGVVVVIGVRRGVRSGDRP